MKVKEDKVLYSTDAFFVGVELSNDEMMVWVVSIWGRKEVGKRRNRIVSIFAIFF